MPQNEKMKILEMLQAGKINAAEAARLLDAVGDGGQPGGSKPVPPTPFLGADSAPRPNGNGGFGGRTGSFTEDLGRRFDSFFKEIEPKLSRFTEAVAKKTVSATDRLSQAITPGAGGSGGSPKPTAGKPSGGSGPFPFAGATEQAIEKKVSSSGSELILSGLNGSVTVKGYNGDKITAKLLIKPNKTGAPIDLAVLGDKYFLQYDESQFQMVSVDAYVPEKLFGVIRLSAKNGAIHLSNISADTVVANGGGGDMELSGITARSIQAEMQNGEMRLTNLTAEIGAFESYSGGIVSSALDIRNMKMNTFNGPVRFNGSGFSAYSDYLWDIQSGNGKLELFLPSNASLGYYLKTHASLGELKLGLTGIQYLVNEKNYAEAKSFRFDEAEKKVRLSLETSNAPLIVN